MIFYKKKESVTFEEVEHNCQLLDQTSFSIADLYERIYMEHNAAVPREYVLSEGAKKAYLAYEKERDSASSVDTSSFVPSCSAKEKTTTLKLILNMHVLWNSIQALINLRREAVPREISEVTVHRAIALHSTLQTMSGLAEAVRLIFQFFKTLNILDPSYPCPTVSILTPWITRILNLGFVQLWLAPGYRFSRIRELH